MSALSIIFNNSGASLLPLTRSLAVRKVSHVAMGFFDTFTFKAIAVSSLLGLQQRIVLHVVTSLSMHAACNMLHPLLL